MCIRDSHVHERREQVQVCPTQKRQQQKSCDDKRIRHAEYRSQSKSEAHSVPQYQQHHGRYERTHHRSAVHHRGYLFVQQRDTTDDASRESERSHAQSAAPVIGDSLAVHARMLAGNVFEHGLVGAHLAHRERNAQPAQGHEHEGNEKRRERNGDKVQRKVDERRKSCLLYTSRCV